MDLNRPARASVVRPTGRDRAVSRAVPGRLALAAGIVPGTHISRLAQEGVLSMEEFEQGLSRAELLKRGAAGAALLAGADALLRLEGAGAAIMAPKPGGKLVVGIGQVFEDINVLTAFGY